MDNCQGQNKIHFIGIGGIGVSALARYFLTQGAKISGSDLSSSEITDDLKKLGVKIAIGPHKAENVPKDVDMIVYSPAVQLNNPERLEIKNRNKKYQIPDTKYQIPILSYPEALGELTKKYFTIAVSGAHGKSTTTAMLANILIRAGLDPTVIIGTKLKEFGDANFRAGKSKYLVIEADEWNASFLNYWPRMIVLTNIDREHLDYYKNLNHIVKTFREYVGHLPEKGTLVINADDRNISKIKNQKSKPQIKIQNYSIKQKEAETLRKILRVPGEHNVYNALAALTAARALKISDKISFQTLSEYRGAWRRFEVLGKFKGADVISDYAHHPAEIKATLAASHQKYPQREIWCVFQPHQVQRTKYLFNDFVSAFDAADKILLLDIYGVAGREKQGSTEVSSEKLAAEIKKRGKDIKYVGDINKAVNLIRKESDKNKVILIMGAGDVWKAAKGLFNGGKMWYN